MAEKLQAFLLNKKIVNTGYFLFLLINEDLFFLSLPIK